MTDDPYRLPRRVLPSRYEILLEPDLDRATFDGHITIRVDVVEDTDQIILNAADLEVLRASITSGFDEQTGVVELHPESERCIIALPKAVSSGTHTIKMVFRGTLNDKLKGWYRSTFRDGETDSAVERVIATTQMQPTDCRRAFPCFDEPDFKAVFSLTLVVADGLTAISNSPEINRRSMANGKTAISFADTMVMSTYLVAMIVGPLEASEPIDVRGTPLRIVHVPGKDHLTAFAKEVGAFCLGWFEDYYGIDYAGDKLDLVALPDFAAGAMENLGCVTFRENVLLVDPAVATQAEEQAVADVVAHEIAHMWFGDLVTMRWWNGIWLNEAFATFMEMAACDAFRPAWQRWVTFSLARSAAMDVDSLVATRPVEFEVVSPRDADGMFDVLTYEKGASLLRMLEQYVGPESFRDGIRTYLTTHQYSNTETDDLWAALETATGHPVDRIMSSWIFQRGYPLVHADLDGGDLVLSQERFLFDPEAVDATRWSIPIHVSQLTDSDQIVLLEGDEVRVPLKEPAGPVVVNAKAYGFFRVAYRSDLLARLTGEHLAALTTPERYALLDDAWASVVAGHLGADQFCRFVGNYRNETELQVWQLITTCLRWCDRFVEGDARDRFRAFVCELVAPSLYRLGWNHVDGEDDLTSELRGQLVRAMALLGNDDDAKTRARTIHLRSIVEPGSIDPAMTSAATSITAATGDETDYQGFLDRFRNAATPQEQLRELYALPDFPTEELADRTLALALSGEVRTQNAPFVIARCVLHREFGPRAWKFIRENWSLITETFPDNTITRMIDPVKSLTLPEQAADVAAFFSEHDVPQGEKSLQQTLERQRLNVGLRQRASAALAAHFLH